MQVFKKCPHCGSGVWVVPHEEPNCEVCGCDTDVLADPDEEIATHREPPLSGVLYRGDRLCKPEPDRDFLLAPQKSDRANARRALA